MADNETFFVVALFTGSASSSAKPNIPIYSIYIYMHIFTNIYAYYAFIMMQKKTKAAEKVS